MTPKAQALRNYPQVTVTLTTATRNLHLIVGFYLLLSLPIINAERCAKMKIAYERCTADRVDSLLQFIDDHWRKNHILTQHRELFDWQHKDNDGNFNFIIATDERGDILGILGYIPTSQFSRKLAANKDVWTAIWKVREDCTLPGVGFGLLRYLKSAMKVECFCAVGLSDMVIPIYNALNFTSGRLDHYVAFSNTRESFGFVKPLSLPDVVPLDGELSMVEIYRSHLEALSCSECKFLFSGFPRKDIDYLINRYVEHPMYQYQMLGFYKPLAELQTIIVLRVIDVVNTKIARIVDVFGHSFLDEHYNQSIYSWLDKTDCEYIDCMTHGLNTDEIENSCFRNVKDSPGLVVPNYFEPLVLSNVTLDFAHKMNYEGDFRIFKGDSDQDRPNIL